MADVSEPFAEFPEKLEGLFEPHRFKVLYGGRGGAKSWNVARALLVLGAKHTLRILCARELQNSMRESVHQLLRDQLALLGLTHRYIVTETEIRGLNGTLIIFAGLRHNVLSIKSKEGIDIVWVEEAETVSAHSWNTLIPTIRKEGSEIWLTFNPSLATAETYKRFVLDPPPNAWVCKVSWRDNPWFPAVLDEERRNLKARDPDAYLTVWEGHPLVALDGAVYANEVRAATSEGRITSVPYAREHPVLAFWDLGRRDLTAIWFVQIVGFQIRVLDYLEDRGKVLAHYVKLVREKPYAIAEHWLPHDGDHELLGAQRTIAEQLRDAKFEVKRVPHYGPGAVQEGINAARTLFARCWFDEVRTAPGVERLRSYRYKVDPDTRGYSKEPLHDDNSNGADAFRYIAVSLAEPKEKKPPRPRRRASGWMGA
jgi:phage terminase large subunit